VKFKK